MPALTSPTRRVRVGDRRVAKRTTNDATHDETRDARATHSSRSHSHSIRLAILSSPRKKTTQPISLKPVLTPTLTLTRTRTPSHPIRRSVATSQATTQTAHKEASQPTPTHYLAQDGSQQQHRHPPHHQPQHQVRRGEGCVDLLSFVSHFSLVLTTLPSLLLKTHREDRQVPLRLPVRPLAPEPLRRARRPRLRGAARGRRRRG